MTSSPGGLTTFSSRDWYLPPHRPRLPAGIGGVSVYVYVRERAQARVRLPNLSGRVVDGPARRMRVVDML